MLSHCVGSVTVSSALDWPVSHCVATLIYMVGIDLEVDRLDVIR